MTELPLVLLVENNPFFLIEHKRFLELDGFAVEVRKTPKEALAFLQEDKRTLTLVAINTRLPHGSEFEEHQTRNQTRTGVVLYRKIREIKPTLPILIYTTSEKLGQENLSVDKNRRIINMVATTPANFWGTVRRMIGLKD